LPSAFSAEALAIKANDYRRSILGLAVMIPSVSDNAVFGTENVELLGSDPLLPS
jgi:hypothetical protein